MKILKLELQAEDTIQFVYALEHLAKKIEEGYTSVDLVNESIKKGSCEIIEIK